MAYEGYFRLDGVEIANAARTVAYTGSLMPTFGLDDCTDCEGLLQALGDIAHYGPEERVYPGDLLRTNLATNPSFEKAATGTVATPVVAENRVTVPFPVGAATPGPMILLGSAWNPGGAGEIQYIGQAQAIRCTTSMTGPPTGEFLRVVSYNNTAASEGTWVGWKIRVSKVGQARSLRATIQFGGGGGASGPDVDITGGAWLSTYAQVPASATATYLDLEHASTNPTPFLAGEGVDVWEVAAFHADTEEEIQALLTLDPFVGGDTGVQGGAFDTHWTGTPNASTSVLVPAGAAYPQAEVPLDFNATGANDRPVVLNGTGVQSTYGAMSGGVSLALVPDGTSTGSTASIGYRGSGAVMPGLVPGKTYTISATITLAAPQTGNTNPSPRIILAPGAQSSPAPNVAGSHRLSVTFTVPPSGVEFFRLYNGSDLPTDVVWWDDVLIEEADEVRPYFDGGGPATLELEHRWRAEANNSISDLVSYEVTKPLIEDRSYTTPAQDGAPWIDSSNPALNDFWGVYPLGVSGIDDSTRTASVTELTGDGAVVSLPRRAGREMRFDALLVGKDKRAVMEGFHWLDRALDGVRCGDRSLGCTGAPLEFFSSCPPACDYSGCPDVVADLSDWSTDGWYVSGNNPTIYYGQFATCPDPSMQYGIRGEDTGPEDLVMTRVMSGLITGGWYKFQAVVTGWNSLPVVSVRGASASIVATVASDETKCTDAALTTLWFQATSPVMYLDITSSTSDDDPSNFHLTDVTRFSVVRADPAADIYKTTWPDDGSALNGWQVGNFDNASTAINRSFFNNVYTAVDWRVPNTGVGGEMAIFSSDGFFLRRTVRGLTPGQRYSVRFSGMLDVSDLPASQTEASVRVDVDGIASSEVILDTADIFAYFGVDVEFVATSDQHEISIGPGSVTMYLEPDPVFFSELSLTLFSLAVEALSEDPPPYPDPALEYRRTLYRTTALTGPTIEERYDKVCGYMLRVSFGLHSGVPDQYGELVNAGSALNQSSFITGNFECVGDEQVRTNLVVNPSGDVPDLVSPWASYNLDSVVSTGDDPGVARFGDGYFVLSLTSPGAAESVGMAYNSPSLIPITPGSFIVSAYIGGDIAPNTTVRLEAEVLDSGESRLELRVSPEFSLPSGLLEGDGMVRVDFPFAVGDLASGLRPAIVVSNTVDGNWDPTIYVDGILTETGGALQPYFDGSFPNAEWVDVPHESESILTPSTVSDLIDPDCPPLPTPPQPPSIEEECVAEPEAWLRYAIEVPGSQIPLFSSVRPVITIITGDVAVRQVRTRWYPNPEGADVTQLRQCDFVGEMTASYVPPNSEFTIDGIAQDAVSVKDNGDISTATHLLYGPDGGPVQWPELSCNVPYVFTVDVEATGDFAEVDILLQLGLKV